MPCLQLTFMIITSLFLIVGTVPIDICDPAARHGQGIVNLILNHNQLTGVLDLSNCQNLAIMDVSVGLEKDAIHQTFNTNNEISVTP